MGLCGSSMSTEEKAALARSKELEAKQQEDLLNDQQLIKLLLLGAGESGKSTIFKQMRVLYGQGFDNDSRKQVNPVICSNLISGTRTMLENCEKLGFDLVSDEAIAARDLVHKVVEDQKISEELAKAISTLWADEQFQKTFAERASFQLFDCYGDFATKIADYPTWGGPDWTPSVSDVMKARVRTSGIVEENYNIDGVDFVMYDVGGQRNERKKWIHCFDNVTAVIFVGAISEYDQVLYEDKSQNRLVEAVDLFDEICNSKWFQETSMILFLNKRDLFEVKFLQRKVPLNITGLPFFESAPQIDWESTQQADAVSQAHEWIVNQFLTKNQTEKEIYFHITCATDTENVKTVFDACKDIILKGNLKGSGFMD
eukprot:maker-scaffold_1-snap-gene-22.61-mRNA-1 protein AED:0.01 eAED:0.01 QI:137/1/1/1/1/1/2/133/370